MKEIAIVAQTTAPIGTPGAATTQATQDAPFWAGPMMPFLLLIILMYVFMFRSKKGQESKRQQMIKALKKGDEVQTIGGEFGRVMETRDDRVLLKVDESSNTKIWYARSAVHKVVGAEKAETK
ncbi:MAG: preprotein translocase subunit YajC [Phycisphaerales bacterium]|nr:preprotein translocase subunit YajC [Phycisphaerales bacterium]MEA2735472.1 preprotein translocase subunit YajC [Humisphaera sp.]